jgi:DNA-binding winged helix-turn-helix (wHTH) protein/tetratricopeptide (TPR) repeat protein
VASAETSTVRFGAFVLEPGERRLTRDGVVVALPPKVFDTLVVLVEAAGHLVEKEVLMARVWPDTFVEDVNLARNISMLRRALGDTQEAQAIIETVPKRGYRLVAPIAGRSDEPSVAAADVADLAVQHAGDAAPAPGGVRSGRPLTWPVALVVTAAVVAAAGGGLSMRRDVPPAGSTMAPAPSLIILPFAVRTDRPEDEFLGRAVADGSSLVLAGRTGLVVRASSTARGYTPGTDDPLALARRLGVDFVTIGTIERFADRFRATVRLMDARTGDDVWASTIEERQDRLLDLQEAIGQGVTAALPSSMRRNGGRPSPRAANATALDALLRGRHFMAQRPAGWQEQAYEAFSAAIAADPHLARAHAGLAGTYLLSSGHLGTASETELVPRARAAAERALELDPDLAEAYATLALIAENYDWNWTGAERRYREAIARDPNYATAHHWYGELLSFFGRFDEAIAELQVALKLDPLSPPIHRDLGQTYRFARRSDRAIEAFRRALELQPGYTAARTNLAGELCFVGRCDEGARELAKVTDPPDSPLMIGAHVTIAAYAGRLPEARRGLERLQRLSKETYVSPMWLVWGHLVLHEDDPALDWLEKALAGHDGALTSLAVDPTYDPVRAHPRFQAVVRALGLDHPPATLSGGQGR